MNEIPVDPAAAPETIPVAPLAPAALTPQEIANREKESRSVQALRASYDNARKFDKDARARYARERRYANGSALKAWRVSVNLIGSFIDILCSYLYARNPDVSV